MRRGMVDRLVDEFQIRVVVLNRHSLLGTSIANAVTSVSIEAKEPRALPKLRNRNGAI
jgi:hypothetical protein